MGEQGVTESDGRINTAYEMGVLSSLCSCVTAKFSIRLRPLVTAFQDRTLIWSISRHVESDKTTSGKKVPKAITQSPFLWTKYIKIQQNSVTKCKLHEHMMGPPWNPHHWRSRQCAWGHPPSFGRAEHQKWPCRLFHCLEILEQSQHARGAKNIVWCTLDSCRYVGIM